VCVRRAGLDVLRECVPLPCGFSVVMLLRGRMRAATLMLSPSTSQSGPLTPHPSHSPLQGGWITYMRTDNPILSEAGMTEARKCAESLYGTTNLAMQARAIKKPKGSQEAHEPIRPAITEEGGGGDAGGFNLRPPLQGQQWQLYEMILQRTLASVMVDAQLHLTTVDVAAFTGNKVAAEGGKAATGTPDSVFRTSGTVIKEPGWMRAYEEGTDTAAGGAGGGERTGGGKLPVLEQGQALGCEGISALSHTTRPPARYTEASFVKELEAEGIGRPSTYSQILETLKDRGYVNVEGKAICPSLIAVVVVQLLERHFTEFVDTAFTARMELSLDCIAEGNAAKETYLGEYYLGPQGLRDKVRMSEENILPEEARRALLPMSFDGDDTGFRNVSIFVGPYGAYAQAKVDEATMLKANLPDAVCRDVQLLTPDTIQACLAAKKGPYNGTLLGHEDESGLPILLRVGRFGAYLQVGQGLAVGDGSGVEDADQVKPRTVSLPKNVPLGEVDMALARKFLSLPRVVCVHPETGKDVLAGVGPYGGFVRHSTTYRSLPAADDVLTIGSERALELLAAASKSSVASQTLANIGQLDGKNITVMKGRYGPYIKFGTVNARIPDMYRDMPEETPLAEAIEAILAKADATKGKGASGRRAGSGTGAGGGVKGKDSAKVKGGVASVAKAGIAKKRAVKAGHPLNLGP
jgi:DNA topoisomerase-1